MKLKEEVKEAAVAWLDAGGMKPLNSRSPARLSADMIRCGNYAESDTSGLVGAMLAVLGQYEEVEVEECCASFVVSRGSHWLRMPDDRFTGRGSHNAVPRTIYMRKPEPAPDLKEVARCAVKAYRDGVLDQRETMAALEKELDK